MSVNIWTDYKQLPLPEVLSFIVDNRGKTVPIDENGTHVLIATNCIRNEYLYPSYDKVRYLNEETYQTWFRAHPLPGDIIFVNKGTPGRVCMVPDPVDFCIAQDMMAFRVNPEIVDNKYLFAILRSYKIQSQIAATTIGDVIPHFKKQHLHEIKIPIPPIDIQKQIGDFYYLLCEKEVINNKINDNLAAQIETFLLAYLNSEGALPVKLGDYLYIKGRIGWKGLKKSEYLSQSEYRIINGETLTQSGIDWNKAGYISEERYVESPEIMLKVGDILLSKDGTIGKIGYVDSLELPTSVASGIFVIRNTKPDIISTTFIYYLLKSRLFTSFIAARTEGSVIPHLYQKDFMEFEFPLPTAEKMAEFEEVTEPMFSGIINNLNENKKLAILRDSLLPKLMSGELDVSELDL